MRERTLKESVYVRTTDSCATVEPLFLCRQAISLVFAFFDSFGASLIPTPCLCTCPTRSMSVARPDILLHTFPVFQSMP